MNLTLKRTMLIISFMIALVALPVVSTAETKATDFNTEYTAIANDLSAIPQSEINTTARRVVETNIAYANVRRTSLDTTIADPHSFGPTDLHSFGPTAVYRRPRCIGEPTALDFFGAKAMQRPPERAQRTLAKAIRFEQVVTVIVITQPPNLPVHRPTIVDLR